MDRTRLWLALALAGCGVLIGAPTQAEAAPFASRGYVSRGYIGNSRQFYNNNYRYNYGYNNNHMPGWDWQRTYPWSAYNAWRNPYWYYPHTPYTSYPYAGYSTMYGSPDYVPSGGSTYYSGYAGNPAADGVPSEPQHTVVIPHPTGELRAPPPDAGVVQVRLPDQFATVMFDGIKSSSVGATRYYVTPQLQAGGDNKYSVSATFKKDGGSVTEIRQITVAPGKTTVVDFNREAAK